LSERQPVNNNNNCTTTTTTNRWTTTMIRQNTDSYRVYNTACALYTLSQRRKDTWYFKNFGQTL